MWFGIGTCDPYTTRYDSRSYAAETCTDYQQIFGKINSGRQTSRMSIIAVGSLAFDSITTPSGRADHVLGGSVTHFSLAASYFTQVRVVAVVGEDFTSEHEAVFKKRGIDTRGIEHAKGRT